MGKHLILCCATFFALQRCTPKEEAISTLNVVERKPLSYTELQEKYSDLDPMELEKALQYDRPDLRRLHELDMTVNTKGVIPDHVRRESYLYVQQMIRDRKAYRAIDGVSWEERGPNNIGGRTRALMFDPNDASAQKVWAGGVTGGLWYNNNIKDARTEWVAVDDFWSNLAISCITYDPGNPKTFYLGTGETYGGARGLGIWKTTDGGATWSQLSGTNDRRFYYTQKIAVTTSGAVLAATTSGLYRSTDGGMAWVRTQTGLIDDIEIASNGAIYISARNRGQGVVYRSLDDGSTFNDISPAPGGKRIEIASSPSSPNSVYAIASDGSNVAWFFKTTDGGNNWSSITTPKYFAQNDCTTPGTEDFTRGQAWYNLILKVHPTNPDILLAGGIDVYKTTDGGATWGLMAYWTGTCAPYLHADQHAMDFDPSNANGLIFGNDGGVAYSPNMADAAITGFTVDVAPRNNGYNVTQFYATAMTNVSDDNFFLAGAQDNGTQRFESIGVNATTEATGGDGSFCHIDQDNPDLQLTSYVFNTHFRSTRRGVRLSFDEISDENSGRFINPTDYDNKANVLYAAANENQFFRISDIDKTTVVKNTLSIPINNRKVSALTVSPYTDNRVFFANDLGDVYIVDDAHGSSPSTTNITTPALPNAYISSIAIGNSDRQLLITYSSYGVNSVWETRDGGSTWLSREGNLPDMPIRWALYNPDDTDQVLLATEMGVWSIDNIAVASPVWGITSTGLANVRCDMLQYREADGLVAVATHGRGLFTAKPFAKSSPTCEEPIGLIASNISTDGFELNWKSSAGAVNYTIDINGTPVNVTGENHIASGLTPRTEYTVTVKANCGSAGSAVGKEIKVKTLAPVTCDVPTALNVSGVGTSGFVLMWDAVSGVKVYDVEINGVITTVNEATYTATGLKENTTYRCRVRADCGGGLFSAYTTTVDITTNGKDFCNVPSGLQATRISSDTFTLSWKAVPGAVSYAVRIGAEEFTVMEAELEVTGRTAGTSYTCRVSANCASGSSTFSGPFEVKTIIEDCAIPEGLRSTDISDVSFLLTWKEVPLAVSYEVDINGELFKTNDTQLLLTLREPSTLYLCKVRTLCSPANSDYSDMLEVNTFGEKVKEVVLVIPKLFTPNGDGNNDLWTIENVEQISDHSMSIYDQSGNRVYEAPYYKNDWNGIFNGKPLSEGAYYYIISKDGEVFRSGGVRIVR